MFESFICVVNVLITSNLYMCAWCDFKILMNQDLGFNLLCLNFVTKESKLDATTDDQDIATDADTAPEMDSIDSADDVTDANPEEDSEPDPEEMPHLEAQDLELASDDVANGELENY